MEKNLLIKYFNEFLKLNDIKRYSQIEVQYLQKDLIKELEIF